MRDIIDLWKSQPLSEQLAGIAFAVGFPLFILAFAVITP
jgi:hypothetical protein